MNLIVGPEPMVVSALAKTLSAVTEQLATVS